MKRILLVAGIIAVLALAATLMAGVPSLINYQGRLTNPAGNPLDTTVSITFSIYADSVGGTPIWTETHPSVSAVNGLFSVILGSLTKSAWILCWDPILGWVECGDYIGITVGASPEITPRTRLTSSMYSIVSGHVSSIDSAKGGTIIGGFAIVGDGSAPKVPFEFFVGGATKVLDIFPWGLGAAPYPGKLSIRNSADVRKIELDGTTGMATVKGFTMSTGAGTDLVLTSDATGVGTWKQGASDLDWDKEPSVTTEVLETHGAWGIARDNNYTAGRMYGSNRNTHINLGVTSATGEAGQNRSYVTVGGGYSNEATGEGSTIAGGYNNTAKGHFSAIVSGYDNRIQNSGVPAGDEARFGAIVGGYNNEAKGNSAFIGAGVNNIAYDNYCAIAGGLNNKAGVSGVSPTDPTDAVAAYVGGGRYNYAETHYATIGGGQYNTITGSATVGTIGGGQYNTISSATFGTIGGGLSNQAAGIKSTIGGGDSNYVSPGALRGTISGGYFNAANDTGAAIGGGYNNTTESTAPYAAIGGGDSNYVEHRAGTIAGGELDSVLAPYGTVGGGSLHFIEAQAIWGTIAGGNGNNIMDSGGAILGGSSNTTTGSFSGIGGGKYNQAGGHCAAIPGGYDNRANGRFSLAAGQQARALHDGSYVWNDNSGGIFASTNYNQYIIHAAGGTGVHTNAPNSTIDINGSMAVAVTPVTGTSFTATWDHCVLYATAAGNTTINLPPAAGVEGRIYYIKNRTSTPGYNVSIDPYSTEKIDDASLWVLGTVNQAIAIVSTGTGWLVISNN